MTINRALGEGAGRLNGAIRAVFLCYAATTAAALVAVMALMTVAWESLGHSAWAGRMLANFDIEWVAELAARYGSIAAMPMLFTILLVLALLAVVWLFLVGGALEVLCAGGTSFSGGCGKHFWRLLRLAVWSGICAIIPFAAGGALGGIGAKVWGGGSMATPLVYWGWFRDVMVIAGLGVVNLAFDYAAIAMAVEGRRQSLRALADAFRLIWRRPAKTLALYAVLGLLLALAMGLAAGISRMSAPASVAAVIALFLFRQAAVLAKTWCWLLFFPAQAAMWRALWPAAQARVSGNAVAAEPHAESSAVESPPAPSTAEGGPPEFTQAG